MVAALAPTPKPSRAVIGLSPAVLAAMKPALWLATLKADLGRLGPFAAETLAAEKLDRLRRGLTP